MNRSSATPRRLRLPRAHTVHTALASSFRTVRFVSSAAPFRHLSVVFGLIAVALFANGCGSPAGPRPAETGRVVITAQPQPLTVKPGQPASFTVAAQGTPPLRYQWRLNGKPIPGATNSSHTIAKTAANHVGAYDVTIANALGAVTSQSAPLAMRVPNVTEGTLLCGNGDPLANCTVTVRYVNPQLGELDAGTASTAADGSFSTVIHIYPTPVSPGDVFLVSTPCCPTQTWTIPVQAGDIDHRYELGTLVCNDCSAPGSSICGTKWADLNGDGARDPNEPGLPGWKIRLMPGNLQAITDSVGNYCFTNLAPNVTYTLSEDASTHPGWTQTYPGGNGAHTVTLPDDIATGIDFGNKADCLATRPAGLVAWWPLDEVANATVLHDLIGGNHAATTPGPISNGGPSDVVGFVLGAQSFRESAATYAEAPDAPALDFDTSSAGAGDFSIDAWIFVPTPGNPSPVRPILDKMQFDAAANTWKGYALYLKDGRVQLVLNDITTPYQSSLTVPSGQWTFVGVRVSRTASAAEVQFYVNGQLETLPPGPAVSLDNSASLRIGDSRFANIAARVWIDELELFNRALAKTEFDALFHAGAAGKCKDGFPDLACLSDLWMKDTLAPDLPEDDGDEPNTTSALIFISRDIWIRTAADALSGTSTNPGSDTTQASDRYYANEHQHEDPVYVSPTTPSYLYAKVRNRGCATSSGQEKLRLYWASASTGLPWPGSGLWHEIDSVPGGAITPISLPPIAPGQDYVAQVAWVPPSPAAFGGNGHFCLIARIEGEPFDMTFPEGPNLADNVTNNNNIVWKNITVLRKQSPTGRVIVRHTLDRPERIALRFAVPAAESKDHFLLHGDIVVDLGPRLLEKWRRGGQRPVGFAWVENTSKIRITDPTNAVLDGLRFDPGEEHSIEVSMELKPGHRAREGAVFHWDITQLAPQKPGAKPTVVGGERYRFTVPVNNGEPAKK